MLTVSTIKHRLLYLIGQTPDQRWNRQLDKLVRGVDPARRGQIRVLIDNYHNSAIVGHGDITNEDRPNLDKTLINIQLEALNKMRSMDLVGFQPVPGPVCKVLNLQRKPDELDPDTMVLSVEDGVVEVKRHNLKLQWSIETMIDMELSLGEVSEFIQAVEEASASELALECDSKVINDIKSVSTQLISQEIRDWKELTSVINQMANGIADRSRRGRGNWAILPLGLAHMLEDNPNYLHFPEDNGDGLQLLGELLPHPDAEHGIRIYTDNLQDDNTILVGYKGGSEIDTGFVYSPYIMAVPLGIHADPESFQPVRNFINRSGSYKHNPENYYTSIQVLG